MQLASVGDGEICEYRTAVHEMLGQLSGMLFRLVCENWTDGGFCLAGIDALRIRVGLELPSSSSPVSLGESVMEVLLTLLSCRATTTRGNVAKKTRRKTRLLSPGALSLRCLLRSRRRHRYLNPYLRLLRRSDLASPARLLVSSLAGRLCGARLHSVTSKRCPRSLKRCAVICEGSFLRVCARVGVCGSCDHKRVTILWSL